MPRLRSACYRVFQSAAQSWEGLFDAVAAFASQLGPDRPIGISHSEGREGWVANGVVTVGYWEEERDQPPSTPTGNRLAS